MALYSELIDRVASGARGIQPLTKNCFKLELGTTLNGFVGANQDLNSLVGALINRTSQANTQNLLRSASNFLLSGGAPLEVEFRPPTLRGEQRSLNIQNKEMKYSGWGKWSEVNINFYNFLEFPTFIFLYHWWCLAHNQNPSFVTEGNLYLPVAESQTRRLRPDQYKISAQVVHYAPAANSPVGNVEMVPHNRWLLKGLYPMSVTPESLSNTDMGSVVHTHVDFSVDHCEPLPF